MKNLLKTALTRHAISDMENVFMVAENRCVKPTEGSVWYDPVLKYNVRVARIENERVYFGLDCKYGVDISDFVKRYEFVK